MIEILFGRDYLISTRTKKVHFVSEKDWENAKKEKRKEEKGEGATYIKDLLRGHSKQS